MQVTEEQIKKAQQFKALHDPTDPLVLFNIWDAGSARVVAETGARALATGSMSVAEAQGYGDGEEIPLDFLLRIADRIAAATELPFTLDFEGGYARDSETLASNITQVIASGAVGVNFEDRIVGGEGLYAVAEQADRIAALRAAAKAAGLPLFINARTDLFLHAPVTEHADLLDAALTREAAYAAAGADGFFVPGLTDAALIQQVCGAASLPVNVMHRGTSRCLAETKSLGAARISYGPGPFQQAMADLRQRCEAETHG